MLGKSVKALIRERLFEWYPKTSIRAIPGPGTLVAFHHYRQAGSNPLQNDGSSDLTMLTVPVKCRVISREGPLSATSSTRYQ